MTNKYSDFLCMLVGKEDEYGKLLNELHQIDFYGLVPNDDNRGEDGKQLRERFVDEEGQQGLSQSQLGECTVLEMLIALAYRLEFETEQSRWEKSPSEWFWILIDNLGLGWCEDSRMIQIVSVDEVHLTVNNFLSRHYKSNGEGGLFPLINPKKDQRRIEIWYQMSAYILENYPI